MSTKESKESPGIFSILKKIDFKKAAKLFSKIDVVEAFNNVSKMNNAELYQLMKLLKGGDKQKALPPIDGDFYDLSSLLEPHEREIQLKVRAFMEKEVAPIANEYWLRDEFPFQLIPQMAKLNIAGLTYEGYSCPNQRFILEGIIAMEMARIDVSISTFFGVHSGLAMGSIYLCGSEEQKQKWLPPMQRMEIIGAFGLTEPEVGSAVAGGLTVTAKRKGDSWILNGQKKWIGNATFSDITIIWARDVDDNQVKGFIVEKETPGFQTEKMTGKMALRITQNALITLTNCKVNEANRLQEANSFKDTSKVLRMTRAGVAWQAVGCARGAYENALAYEIEKKGLEVKKQVGLPFIYQELKMNIGYRIDLLVENKVIIEVKSVEALADLHYKQLLTYLKLSEKKLGILVNFNTDKIDANIKRIVNNLDE